MSEGHVELREIDVRAPAKSWWRISVPYLLQPALAADPRSASFQLVGTEPRSRSFVRLRGRVGDSSLQEDRWTLPTDLSLTAYSWYAAGGPRALALAMRMPQSRLFFQPWMIALFDPTMLYRHELWTVGGGPPRRIASAPLTLSCAQPGFGAEAILCTTLEGRSTRISSVIPSQDLLTPVAVVDRPFTAHAIAAASGGSFAAASGADVVLIDGVTRRGRIVSAARTDAGRYVVSVALAGDRLAVLTAGDEQAEIALFDLAAAP
jgi:hypothetical protein